MGGTRSRARCELKVIGPWPFCAVDGSEWPWRVRARRERRYWIVESRDTGIFPVAGPMFLEDAETLFAKREPWWARLRAFAHGVWDHWTGRYDPRVFPKYEFPLSQSYRAGWAMVTEAQRYANWS